MSPITTHVLDTARGCPAAGVPMFLEKREEDGNWREVGRGATDEDGRCRTLLAPGSLEVGVYRLVFETWVYFQARGQSAFYPIVPVVFEIADEMQHYHVPLLLSPYGYSTYRGS